MIFVGKLDNNSLGFYPCTIPNLVDSPSAHFISAYFLFSSKTIYFIASVAVSASANEANLRIALPLLLPYLSLLTVTS